MPSSTPSLFPNYESLFYVIKDISTIHIISFYLYILYISTECKDEDIISKTKQNMKFLFSIIRLILNMIKLVFLRWSYYYYDYFEDTFHVILEIIVCNIFTLCACRCMCV